MEIYYDAENSKNRWLAYFDLLGTKNLVASKDIYSVFAAYQMAFEKLARWKERHSCVSYSWFSDTFIIYTDDESAESFEAIEMVCRWFIFSLITKKIPLRGALSCGELYVDENRKIFLGKALLESYEYGENQDWLGFILSPSSVERLETLSLPIEERLNYCYYEIPFKKSIDPTVKCAAFMLGNLVVFGGSGKNPLLEKIEEMLKSQREKGIIKKYTNTIEFIHNRSRIPGLFVNKRQ